MMTPEQYERLPKYARDEIDRLNRLLDRSKVLIEQLNNERSGGSVDTGIFWQESMQDVKHWIPRWAIVHCPVGEKWRETITLSRNTDGDIEISTLAGSILVQPWTANKIKLHRRDW